ncbi:hypothetical protein [Leptotrichia trevisanii]|uniref:hypothetical protein n=1 Tax=Leptotrichia trevisanii TaxID=109328 RepID=UPI0026F0D9DC|nr:hypothetical protein [Leptotrichia trevisanii]
MINSLIEKHLDSIVKIVAFDDTGKMIKLFTGSFYISQNFNSGSNFSNNNNILIITAKHSINDDRIAKLELSYRAYNEFKKFQINLSEYETTDVPDFDLSVIHVKKSIYYNFSSRTLKTMIYSKDSNPYNNLIKYQVTIPGYYDKHVEPCIVEYGEICSRYNMHRFYIKSKSITEGYSGAPVFINLLINNSRSPNPETQLFLIGYVSKKVGNNNIEIVSAENLLLIDEILKRKCLSSPTIW